ncbi:MAG: VWA domain-containing protein [Calditrichaeota bacterium]|nr:VWA domain-containing protein [Calditrichota bacterium]
MHKLFVLLLSLQLLLGCASKDESVPFPPDPVGLNPPVLPYENVTPSVVVNTDGLHDGHIRFFLGGMTNPETGGTVDIFYNEVHPSLSSIFVFEDGIGKGLRVTPIAMDTGVQLSLTFVVDNSGSMGAEADAIATSISGFAQYLDSSGLNVRFGIVGYDEYGNISGALDFTTSDSTFIYLDRGRGTMRTQGFGGGNASVLQQLAADSLYRSGGENGAMAIAFAEDNFDWSNNNQGVYVNFTDTCLLPKTNSPDDPFSLQTICARLTEHRTVHTVFSSTRVCPDSLYHPGEISDCTAGITEFVSSDASDLDLLQLDLLEAIVSGYLVEYVTSSPPDTTHQVDIWISSNGAYGRTTITPEY